MKHCGSEQAQTADPVFPRPRLILKDQNWIKSPCPEWNWKPKYPMPKCLKAFSSIWIFLTVASVMKTRKYLKCGRFTACLDQVEGLGDFLELEVIAEQESERKEILSKMEDLLAILGYHMSDTVQTSYLSMLQKKYKVRISCLIRLNQQEYFRMSI